MTNASSMTHTIELNKPLILVAEDDIQIHTILRTALSVYGYRVTLVEDGAAAIAAVKANPHLFQCVLLDLMMPKVNGIQAAEAIHQISSYLPIILMTGSTLPTLPDHSPIVGLLQKPFLLTELERLIALHATKYE